MRNGLQVTDFSGKFHIARKIVRMSKNNTGMGLYSPQ
jgi:hypothetical protein